MTEILHVVAVTRCRNGVDIGGRRRHAVCGRKSGRRRAGGGNAPDVGHAVGDTRRPVRVVLVDRARRRLSRWSAARRRARAGRTGAIGERLCLCVSASISPEIHARPIFAKFLSVARSSCGSVAICYVLPVLWMTSYLRIRQAAQRGRPADGSTAHMQPSTSQCCKPRVGIPVAGQWIYTHVSTFLAPPSERVEYS